MEFHHRYQVEKDFHDRRAAENDVVGLYSYGILAAADRYAYELPGPLQGKVVLDLGCGGGHHAVAFAERGAFVYAVDLSPGMVEKAKNMAKEKGVEARVTALQMNAEALEFPDETFDIVFGHSILHHLNLELARSEVHRVLKRGGKGVFLEPLGHNIFINLFRKITPGRRTSTEKPLRMRDVLFFAEPFSSLKHREFYLLALSALALFPFPNKRPFQKAFAWLSKLDDHLLAQWPILGRYAWVTVFEVMK